MTEQVVVQEQGLWHDECHGFPGAGAAVGRGGRTHPDRQVPLLYR